MAHQTMPVSTAYEAANPMAAVAHAQPVTFVPLIPVANADDAPMYLRVPSHAMGNNEKVQRLSRIVLQLAMLNFLLVFLLRLAFMIYGCSQGWCEEAVGIAAIQIAIPILVLMTGVQGVRTRNAACCSSQTSASECCGCGYLHWFHGLNAFFCCLSALSFIFQIGALMTGAGLWVLLDLLYSVVFGSIECACAVYAKELLDEIYAPQDIDIARGVAASGGVASSAHTAVDIAPVAHVQVGGPVVAMATANGSASAEPSYGPVGSTGEMIQGQVITVAPHEQPKTL